MPRNNADFEYRTEVDRTSQGTADRDAPMLTKTAYQAKHGWVSALPQGHPDHTPMVSKDEQTKNMAFERRRNNYTQPWTKGS